MSMTVEEIEKAIKQLERQQAEQTEALRCALEGHWAGGADTVAGHVNALNPTIELHPKEPTYA
jgi:hypothetical protein